MSDYWYTQLYCTIVLSVWCVLLTFRQIGIIPCHLRSMRLSSHIPHGLTFEFLSGNGFIGMRTESCDNRGIGMRMPRVILCQIEPLDKYSWHSGTDSLNWIISHMHVGSCQTFSFLIIWKLKLTLHANEMYENARVCLELLHSYLCWKPQVNISSNAGHKYATRPNQSAFI